jgi:hypothetical protein
MPKGEPMDPGSVLDKVVASTTAAEESILYQLANYKKGGTLIDEFNKGGSKEVRANIIGYIQRGISQFERV